MYLVGHLPLPLYGLMDLPKGLKDMHYTYTAIAAFINSEPTTRK